MVHCRNSRHMLNALCDCLFLSFSIVPEAAFGQQSAISDYLYFDNHFNVIQRLRTEENKKENLMSEEDRKPVDVNLYEIPLQPGSSNRKVLSRANYFSDQGVSIDKDIWYHSAIYTGQGVTSHLTGFQRQQRHLLTFLKAYIAEAERILEQNIPLTDDTKKVLENLELRPLKEGFYSGELNESSPRRNAMASVLKPIFAFSHQVKIQKIETELKNAIADQDQSALKKAFYKALTAQRVVFMGLDERSKLIGEDTKTTWLRSTLQAYLKLGLGRNKSLESVDFFKSKSQEEQGTSEPSNSKNRGGGAIRYNEIFGGIQL